MRNDAAAAAAIRVMEALSGPNPGVVLIDDDNRVRLRSFAEVKGRQTT
ncbi:hypothetical protein [Amycolatopsis sp.]|nr:hypothetical protein [Amycolatopsis sp.]